MTKVKLGIIYGGKSTESSISIKSACAFSQWIDYDKYTIIPIYINDKGIWNFGEDRTKAFKNESEMKFSIKENKNFKANLNMIDVAVPLLSGMNGEDGSIQGLFEMFNIPYTGNGIESSALSMNKILTKRFLQSYGINFVDDVNIHISTWKKHPNKVIINIEKELYYPMIVKPARLGSSIGISKVNNKEELIVAINKGFEYDLDLLIENYIEKTEINVSVLQNKEQLIISKPGIVISENEFYSYEDKYSEDSTAIKKVADLKKSQCEQLYKYSKKTFKAIQGRGLMRLDYFIDQRGRIILNEINTLPSLGGSSVYPYLLNESGISNGEIVDYLIQSAIDIHEKKNKLYYTF